jgi:hypothetical protein
MSNIMARLNTMVQEAGSESAFKMKKQPLGCFFYGLQIVGILNRSLILSALPAKK